MQSEANDFFTAARDRSEETQSVVIEVGSTTRSPPERMYREKPIPPAVESRLCCDGKSNEMERSTEYDRSSYGGRASRHGEHTQGDDESYSFSLLARSTEIIASANWKTNRRAELGTGPPTILPAACPQSVYQAT
nr:hypothetical protein CFP56_69445 [Quercus suber]